MTPKTSIEIQAQIPRTTPKELKEVIIVKNASILSMPDSKNRGTTIKKGCTRRTDKKTYPRILWIVMIMLIEKPLNVLRLVRVRKNCASIRQKAKMVTMEIDSFKIVRLGKFPVAYKNVGKTMKKSASVTMVFFLSLLLVISLPVRHAARVVC